MKGVAGIYLITNLVNGMIYIGYSKDIGKRWEKHKRYIYDKKHNFYPLYVAMKEFGVVNFIISILEIIEDHSKLGERETYWIKRCNPIKIERGYNSIISFKDGTENKKAKEYKNDGCRRIAEYQAKKWAERKAKGLPFNAGMVGKKHSQKTKDQMRETHLKIVEDSRKNPPTDFQW